jgi:hypothetical protein
LNDDPARETGEDVFRQIDPAQHLFAPWPGWRIRIHFAMMRTVPIIGAGNCPRVTNRG